VNINNLVKMRHSKADLSINHYYKIKNITL